MLPVTLTKLSVQDAPSGTVTSPLTVVTAGPPPIWPVQVVAASDGVAADIRMMPSMKIIRIN